MKKRSLLVAAILVFGGVMIAPFAIRMYRHREKPLPKGECTWYAFERARQAGWEITFDQPFGRHARNWWERVTNGERRSEPQVGAIMILDEWPGNPYGHVGYVESVESPSVWIVTHANYPMGQPDNPLQDVPVFRVRCERTPDGVKLDPAGPSFRLRGFLYPPGQPTKVEQ